MRYYYITDTGHCRKTLFNLAKREGKMFAGSTSSLTSLLSHIYFVISGGKGVDISVLSSAFADEVGSLPILTRHLTLFP
jgi:Mitochondrial protein Pet127